VPINAGTFLVFVGLPAGSTSERFDVLTSVR
jgi:hypothetical protein